MKIGILLCGNTAPLVVANHGAYATMFERLLAAPGREFSTWSVVTGEFPEGPEVAEAWVMTGSPHGVYDSLPFIAPLEEFTRAVASAKRPLAGICFGHQLIAQALGGTVAKHPGGWRIGPQAYDVDGAKEPVRLHAWHQDQVSVAPPGARIMATGPDCKNAGMLIGDHIMTLQPHPEFTDGVVRDLITARRDDPGFAHAPFVEAEAELGSPIDTAWAAQRIGSFLDRAGQDIDG